MLKTRVERTHSGRLFFWCHKSYGKRMFLLIIIRPSKFGEMVIRGSCVWACEMCQDPSIASEVTLRCVFCSVSAIYDSMPQKSFAHKKICSKFWLMRFQASQFGQKWLCFCSSDVIHDKNCLKQTKNSKRIWLSLESGGNFWTPNPANHNFLSSSS